MDDVGTIIAFYLLAAITIGSSVGVVVVRNIIHSVVMLIVSFVGVAGLYITLSADFIAMAQILIYVGAVSILFLFAIVLTPRSERGNPEGFLRLPAVALCILVGATLIFVAMDTDWALHGNAGFEETSTVIGEALLDKYVLPFEIASILLLAAIIGSIVLVRPEPMEEDE